MPSRHYTALYFFDYTKCGQKTGKKFKYLVKSNNQITFFALKI